MVTVDAKIARTTPAGMFMAGTAKWDLRFQADGLISTKDGLETANSAYICEARNKSMCECECAERAVTRRQWLGCLPCSHVVVRCG